MGLDLSLEEVDNGLTTTGVGFLDVISADGGRCLEVAGCPIFFLLVLEEQTVWRSFESEVKDVKVAWKLGGLSEGEQFRARRLVETGLMSLMYHFLGTTGFIRISLIFLFFVLCYYLFDFDKKQWLEFF
jgi:hypothetical protein